MPKESSCTAVDLTACQEKKAQHSLKKGNKIHVFNNVMATIFSMLSKMNRNKKSKKIDVFEESNGQGFPNLMKTINSQIQEAQKPKRQGEKEITLQQSTA